MRVASHTFLDFALGDAVDTRVRADGQVELSSRNLLSNPDMRDVDANGRVEGVELLSGPVPSGRHIYVRYLRDGAGAPQRDTHLTRQNSNTVDLDATYPLNEPIVEEAEPQDASRRSKLPRLPAPEVEVITNSKAGFPAGWIGIAVCGVVGNPRKAGAMRFTTPSPVVAVQAGQGNYIRVFLPQLAEGLSGWGILATEPQTTLTAAMNAPLYNQRILDGNKRIRNPYPLVGPLKTRVQAKTENETYIGAYGEHPPPRFDYGPGGPFTLAAFSTRLSYSVKTDAGWSAQQQYRDVDTTAKAGPGAALYIDLPRNARELFPGIKEWRLEFVGPDKLWYAEAPLPVGSRARMQTNDPEGYHPSNKPEQIERSRTDETGIPAPDAELDPPEAFGPTYPLPGIYAVREALEEEGDDSKEGPPSPATTVTITQGQYFRVKPPAIGNRLPNAELSEKNPETGDPAGWTFTRIAGVVMTTSGGVLSINDTTGATTDYNPATTGRVYVGKAGSRETFRVIANMTRYTSGKVAVIARFLDATGIQLGFNSLALPSSVTEAPIEISMGPSGSPAEVVWPAGTAYIEYAILSQGSTAAGSGPRDFKVELRHFGSFRGLAASRKRPQQDTDLVPVTENPLDGYHPGPYSFALDNPANRHADLAGITLNVVEYYAPYGTPASPDNLLVGYRTPVKPGQLYVPSVYAGWRGVSVATALLEAVIKDAKGNTVQSLGPLVSGVSGTSADARRLAPGFTVHPDAAYLEIVGGGGSDGRVRVYAFQLDEGAVTAYTNQNALSGTMRVTKDTALQGQDDDVRLQWLSAIKQWTGASIISTEDDGTSTDVSFRTTSDNPAVVASPDWGAWTADFEAVPKRRYWQIEAQLSATDPTRSPLVSWMGVELLRFRTMLLRPDGSEYPGGIQAADVRAPHPKPIYETIVSDSNVATRRSRGNERDEREMDLQAYTDEAVRLLHKDIATGEPNIIESPDMGVRLGVLLDPENISFGVDREKKHPQQQPVKVWLHDTSVGFEVVSEEPIV